MTVSTSALREELVRLGPWHMEVEITPELSTAASLDAPVPEYPAEFGEVSFYRPREGFTRRVSRLFPEGLAGRSVLDCACNCGAYLFYMKELGAGECFGFDVREHWIKQARFLAENRTGPGSDIRFEVMDLYDLPELGLERFDITLFHGIFYHLPTPVAGLKIAADLTSELVILNTATRNGLPDGVLAVSEESEVALNSGVYGLNWFPTGPEVIARIFNSLGFSESRCSRWRTIVPQQPARLGRLEVFAARSPETFRSYDKGLPHDELTERVRFFVIQATPADASVLYAGDEDELLDLEGRQLRRFPQDGSASVEQLEELCAEGARYLVVPATAFGWLEENQRLREHLENSHRLAWSEHGTCLIYLLAQGPSDS
jgi:tRNA (mo5U34)-methyltransferase